MVPNLDLILVSLLYGTFLFCILLFAVAVSLIALFLAFTSCLLSIAVFDLYNVSLMLGPSLDSVKADLRLGSAVVLYWVLRFTVPVVFASKPVVQRKIMELKEMGLIVMNHYQLL